MSQESSLLYQWYFQREFGWLPCPIFQHFNYGIFTATVFQVELYRIKPQLETNFTVWNENNQREQDFKRRWIISWDSKIKLHHFLPTRIHNFFFLRIFNISFYLSGLQNLWESWKENMRLPRKLSVFFASPKGKQWYWLPCCTQTPGHW